MLTPPPTAGCTMGEGGAMCLRPVESDAGVGDRDHAAQKAPEGDERQTHPHTICPL